MASHYESWGRYPRVPVREVLRVRSRHNRLRVPANKTVLPYGAGRSQGDSCMNDYLLDTRELDHFIAFDPATGRLRLEAGVLLAAVNAVTVPAGWFLPVTPGTKFVTIGGAIANDVHGKNHLTAGTFGRHVRQFELRRSDGTAQRCSSTENAELFAATIGGLGLTGLITWAEIQLRRVPGSALAVRRAPFRSITHLLELVEGWRGAYEYFVGQFDGERYRTTGWLAAGRHEAGSVPPPRHRMLSVPIVAPNWLLNPVSIRAYYDWYRYRAARQPTQQRVHYDPYFYPLDSIGQWNYLYGPRGFVQYQAVVPRVAAELLVTKLLALMKQARQPSYLASLKMFGDLPSPGLLSFPRAGLCVALDFPMRGSATLRLLAAFDETVQAAGGRVYPAKDARLSAAAFQAYYPVWQQFSRFVDPRFSSAFWRRVSRPAVRV